MSKYIVEVEVEARDADKAREEVDYFLLYADANARTISARLKDDRDAIQPHEDFDNG